MHTLYVYCQLSSRCSTYPSSSLCAEQTAWCRGKTNEQCCVVRLSAVTAWRSAIALDVERRRLRSDRHPRGCNGRSRMWVGWVRQGGRPDTADHTQWVRHLVQFHTAARAHARTPDRAVGMHAMRNYDSSLWRNVRPLTGYEQRHCRS